YSDKNIGKELISKNGDFVTLNLKIKDDAKKGKTQISFNGNPEFYDKNQKGVSVTTNKGEIEIK
ncbi:cohesin domain-containing protein, partial [Escherichia coli]|nr:cohesin domain-containing protein [Escherichia coli]